MNDSKPGSVTRVDVSGVHCPQCGYDLRGIPEHRCPECGFGYDHRAIRSIASRQIFTVDSAFRLMIILSVLAIALLMPQICRSQAIGFRASVLLISAGVFSTYFTHRQFANPRPPGYFDHGVIRTMIVLLSIWLLSMLLMLPQLGVLLAMLCVFVAWYVGARVMLQSPVALQMAEPDVQDVIRKRRVLAIATASIASTALLTFW